MVNLPGSGRSPLQSASFRGNERRVHMSRCLEGHKRCTCCPQALCEVMKYIHKDVKPYRSQKNPLQPHLLVMSFPCMNFGKTQTSSVASCEDGFGAYVSYARSNLVTLGVPCVRFCYNSEQSRFLSQSCLSWHLSIFFEGNKLERENTCTAGPRERSEMVGVP